MVVVLAFGFAAVVCILLVIHRDLEKLRYFAGRMEYRAPLVEPRSAWVHAHEFQRNHLGFCTYESENPVVPGTCGADGKHYIHNRFNIEFERNRAAEREQKEGVR